MRHFFQNNSRSTDFPPYLLHFQLRIAPFAKKVGTSFFYADAGRAQYLDMLQHLTQYSEELLLVVGEEGIGKSTLLEKYLERSDTHWHLCRINGEQEIGIDALFARLAECFGVELATVETSLLFETLQQHLNTLLGLQLSILVIDDADKLSDDALEMVFLLAALEGEDGKLLRVLLFSDTTIIARLASPNLLQLAPPQKMHLQGMEAADSSAYLLHRMRQAGYVGTSPFNSDELRVIQQESQGVPARINQAAHSTLIAQMRGGRKGMRVGIAVVVLLAILLVMREQITELLSDDAESGGTPQVASEEVIDKPQTPAVTVKTESTVTEVVVAETVNAVVEPLVIKEQQSSDAPELMPEDDMTVKVEAAVDIAPPSQKAPLLKSVLPDPVVASDHPQTIVITGRALEAESKVAVSWNGQVEVLEPSQVEVQDSEHMALTLTTGKEAGTWAVQVSTKSDQRSNVMRFEVVVPEVDSAMTNSEPKTEPTKSVEKTFIEKKAVGKTLVDKKSAQANTGKIKGSDWVKAQPDSNYTLQLLASAERKALDLLVAEQRDLKEPLGSFEQNRNGKRLHVLTQGSYTNQKQAETAAKQIPKSLRPWVRDFFSIKQVMVTPSPSMRSLQTTAGSEVKDTAWVWSQPPSHYTIQLSGAGDEVALEAVMRGVSLPGELAVVQSQRNGKPWYTLIYGRFSTKEAAKGTVTRLPKSLRKGNPWIRQFSAIQNGLAEIPSR